MENYNIKVNKDNVSVTLNLPPWKPGNPKVRYYENWARQKIKDDFPKIELGRTITPCVVKSQGPKNKGTWVFELIQKEEKSSTNKKTKTKEKVKIETVETNSRTSTNTNKAT